MTDDHHYQMLGSAFVRGRSLTDGNPELPSDLLHTPLEQLDDPQRASLFQAGVAAGLRMNKFKKTMGLPRVKRVLGVLRCVCPTAILDIGSGRGAFLWPLPGRTGRGLYRSVAHGKAMAEIRRRCAFDSNLAM